MDDNDFPGMAGDRLGVDLRQMMALRQGLSGGGIDQMVRGLRGDRLMPRWRDPMAPENSEWLYDGTQPPETFGV